jgi:hypothetical protein
MQFENAKHNTSLYFNYAEKCALHIYETLQNDNGKTSYVCSMHIKQSNVFNNHVLFASIDIAFVLTFIENVFNVLCCESVDYMKPFVHFKDFVLEMNTMPE